MQFKLTVAAAGIAALAGCSHPAAPCTSAIQMARWEALMQADMRNAQNGTPIPKGASWPQKAADLASNPQVTDEPWDQSAVNSLYWDRQTTITIPAEITSAPPICGTS